MGCVHSTTRTQEALDAYAAACALYESAPSAFKEACRRAYVEYIPKEFLERMWMEPEWEDASGYVWGFAQVTPGVGRKGAYIRVAVKKYDGWSAEKVVRAPDWNIIHIEVVSDVSCLAENDPLYAAWRRVLPS